MLTCRWRSAEIMRWAHPARSPSDRTSTSEVLRATLAVPGPYCDRIDERDRAQECASAKRKVVCYDRPLADGRFLGMVSVQMHARASVATVVSMCPGSDVTADDAIGRAKAWAHVHYPIE